VNENKPLYGRDRLLAGALRCLRDGKPGLYLVGSEGVGKTAVLEWLHRHYAKDGKPRGVLVSCRWAKKEWLMAVAKAFEVEVKTRSDVPSIEKAILQLEGEVIFLDHAEELKPALRTILEPMKDRGWRLVIAAKSVKNGYEKLYWGLKRYHVEPLRQKESERMAKDLVVREGLSANPVTVARESRGYPARIVALARGEPVMVSADERHREDEIDISPALLVLVVGAIVMRTTGLATDTVDLYILGGMAGGFGLFVSVFLMETCYRKKSKLFLRKF